MGLINQIRSLRGLLIIDNVPSTRPLFDDQPIQLALLVPQGITVDTARLAALRGIRAAFLTEMKKDNSETLPDETCVALLRRLEKQRRESIDAFEKAGRTEQAAAEAAAAVRGHDDQVAGLDAGDVDERQYAAGIGKISALLAEHEVDAALVFGVPPSHAGAAGALVRRSVASDG